MSDKLGMTYTGRKRLLPSAPSSSTPSLWSLKGNGTIPLWESPVPSPGTACSPTGKSLFPTWEKTRTHAGNGLFPGREKFPGWERAGRQERPSCRGATSNRTLEPRLASARKIV